MNATGVLPGPAKTSAIANFPRPKDKKGVRRVFGLCAYYRCFVANFARIAEPLTRLTIESTPFSCENDQEKAFCEMQQCLQNPPVLAHFDENAATEMHTDASDIGLGAVLIQKQSGYEKVIAYASRGLSKEERNYSASEKECLAII